MCIEDVVFCAMYPLLLMACTSMIELAIGVALCPIFKHLPSLSASEPMHVILCMLPLCMVIDLIFGLLGICNPYLLIVPFILNSLYTVAYLIIFIYNIIYSYKNKIWDDSLTGGDDWA